MANSRGFSWRCPYCDHHATIGVANHADHCFRFNHGNIDGHQSLWITVIVCPNKACARLSLDLSLHDYRPDDGGQWDDGEAKMEWSLLPASSARPMPSFVPAPIVADYNEACAIKVLSPKASATLARRCLQGMIRDFHGIAKKTLFLEIEALKDIVDPVTWGAIDAIRRIGNIGAHMEKDIDVIVDVDTNEAQLLISLIETLVQDWYVLRHQRNERFKSVVAIAESKQSERRGAN